MILTRLKERNRARDLKDKSIPKLKDNTQPEESSDLHFTGCTYIHVYQPFP